jgi:hypothetical protein
MIWSATCLLAAGLRQHGWVPRRLPRPAHPLCCHSPPLPQCLMGGQSAGFAAVMSELPGETAGSSGKRRREGEGEIAAAVDDDDMEGDSEEGGGAASGRAPASRGRACKKGRGPGTDAATVKAHREKARRERLNEWCAPAASTPCPESARLLASLSHCLLDCWAPRRRPQPCGGSPALARDGWRGLAASSPAKAAASDPAL